MCPFPGIPKEDREGIEEEQALFRDNRGRKGSDRDGRKECYCKRLKVMEWSAAVVLEGPARIACPCLYL